jgi:hypothetical protein
LDLAKERIRIKPPTLSPEGHPSGVPSRHDTITSPYTVDGRSRSSPADVIPARKYSEQEGYAKAKREATLPPEFYDTIGEPRWYEIAKCTKERLTRLKPGFETEFVGDRRASPRSRS